MVMRLNKYERLFLSAFKLKRVVTVKDIASLGLPRSRVYDTGETLARNGFIEIIPKHKTLRANPTKYRSREVVVPVSYKFRELERISETLHSISDRNIKQDILEIKEILSL